MDYTKEQLTAALAQADAAQDMAAVNELVGMLDSLEASAPVEGYDPAAFTSGENYNKTFGAMGETIADVPVFAKELGQEFDDPANPEKVFAFGASKRGLLGTGLDLLGQGAKLSAMQYSDMIPDTVEKKIVDSLSETARVVAENPLINAGLEAAKSGFTAYMEWKDANPRSGRAMEGVFNTAELFAPPLKRKPVRDTSLIRTLADEQYARSIHLESGKRRDYLNTVIEPIQTPANDLKRAERMTQDEKGRNSYTPTETETEMVNVLQGIEDINSDKSFVAIRETLEKEVNKTHNSLNKLLGKSKFKFNKAELNSQLKKRVELDLKDNPVLVGDAGKVAERIYSKALDLLKKSDGSPSSVMDVRRQLDDWVKSNGKSSFDGNENAYTVAQRSIRDFLNEKVAEAVPNTKVLEKLRRQHLLLRTKDRVLPKAAQEADTKIGRLTQNVGNALDVSMPKTPLGKIANIGIAASVLGGAAFVGALPALTGLAATGTLGYAVYRQSVSPTLRRSLSAALRQVDDVLAKKSLGNDMRKALQTDRAMLVEIMKLPTAPEGADDDEGTIDE
jgi:hypothetical protein